jgi:hypothetical protein
LADPPAAFARATHYLLDTRLMIAWAQALAAQGHDEAARHVADRLREFRKADAQAFFGACAAVPAPDDASFQARSAAPGSETAQAGAAGDSPFQCRSAAAPLPWRTLPMIGR